MADLTLVSSPPLPLINSSAKMMNWYLVWIYKYNDIGMQVLFAFALCKPILF
jgi:hypothetical protein